MSEKQVLVRGTVMWASTQKLDFFGEDEKGKYRFDLTNLSDAARDALKGLGLRPRNGANLDNPKPEKGWFIVVTQRSPFEILDAEGNKVEVELGNGTVLTAKIRAYQHEKATKPSAKASDIRVVSLVPFVEGEGGEYDPDDAL